MRPEATLCAPRRRLAVVVSAVVGLALAGCVAPVDERPVPDPTAPASSTPVPPSPSAGPTGADGGEEVVAYRPGREAYVLVPQDPSAVVVLVPGGSWRASDPTGFRLLGGLLATHGVAAVTVTYGTASTGDHHPVPAQDVACAVALAAAEVPGVPVVLVGHSAGAHLALLVGLRPDQGGECDHGSYAADGVVGLAGPYRITSAPGPGADYVGVPLTEDPDRWADADPLTWAAERPGLPVLLVHGTADDVVPPAASEDAAAALTAGGHDVSHIELAQVDHLTILRPDVVADDVLAWVLDRSVLEAVAPAP